MYFVMLNIYIFAKSALLSKTAMIVENQETIQELYISSKAKKHILYTIPEIFFYKYVLKPILCTIYIVICCGVTEIYPNMRIVT